MIGGQPRATVPVAPIVAVGAPVAVAAALYWGVGFTVTPPVRRLLEPFVLWRVRTERPAVALTFDDGPDPHYTDRFLAALSGAPATFFVLGESVRRWPEIARRTSAAGCELGCHGDTHRSLAWIPPLATVRALERAQAAVAEVAGSPPRYYRPAYGFFNLAGWVAAPRLGMRRTLWSQWARDWEASATPELIASRTLAGAKPGAVLLLHDSDGSSGAPGRTLAALPAILTGLRERGLEPVTLSELVASGATAGLS